MKLNIEREVAGLNRMTVRQLRERYAEIFGDETKTGNKTWLVRRIAWRLQANAEGGLSERARVRAEEIANDSDLRLSPPKVKPVPAGATATTSIAAGKNRLPPTGSILTRVYKGQTIQLMVLERGFEFEGETYKSLSAIAKKVTGTHTNGFLFFKLTGGAE